MWIQFQILNVDDLFDFFVGCFDDFIFFAIIAGFDVNWMDN